MKDSVRITATLVEKLSQKRDILMMYSKNVSLDLVDGAIPNVRLKPYTIVKNVYFSLFTQSRKTVPIPWKLKSENWIFVNSMIFFVTKNLDVFFLFETIQEAFFFLKDIKTNSKKKNFFSENSNCITWKQLFTNVTSVQMSEEKSKNHDF